MITRRDRPILAGEVKWGTIKKSDVGKFLDKVVDMDCRKVLITKFPCEIDEVEVLTPEKILELARNGPGADEGKSRY